ncbi:MAG: helix-turn-helix transcriptional regulator [Solirubrobacterales bacterium]
MTAAKTRSETARQFGSNLRYSRRRSGVSQEELGYRASLHRTEISLLERGERTPRIDTLVKLAHSLEVPPEELLDGIEWSPGRAVAGNWAVSVENGD